MDRISEMPSAFESVKTKLLNEFPSEKIQGLNTDRVVNFIRSEELQVKPFIIFDKEDLPKVQEIVGHTGLLRSAFSNGERGLYSPEMDLVLVLRDKEYEKTNGAIYTEGLLVHELAHASSMYSGYITPDNEKFYTARVGFCLSQNRKEWGWVLEEGWADMNRGNYVKKYATVEEKDKLTRALKFMTLDMDDTIPIRPFSGDFLPLPVKYFYVTPEGLPTTTPSAYAGFTLESICKHDPNFASVLVDSRKSVEGLRKFAAKIEKLNNGLYYELQKSSYTEKSFSEKLSIVLSRVDGGIKNVINAKGQLKDWWDSYFNRNQVLSGTGESDQK